jgi:hypothetical protein
MFKVNKIVDYLSLTLKFGSVPDWIIGTQITDLEYSPNKNYNTAQIAESGAIIMFHTEYENVGTHVICSGDTLGNLRGEGHSDIDICTWCLEHKASRIDIAVTAENINMPYSASLTPMDIARLADSEQMKSRLKPDNGITDSSMKLETAYIGSRLSRNRILRAYDKGKQLGEIADKIIRYELETRKNAQGIVRAVSMGSDIGGIIKRYVDFPTSTRWQSIMNAPSVRMPQLETNQTTSEKEANKRANRWYWLMTSVAPALARALIDDIVPYDENENLRLFNVHVDNIIRKLENETDD